MLHAMIMAGGAGTRFWPASRTQSPKQLLRLTGQESMLQATIHRLGSVVPADRVLIMTNERLVEPVAEQLPQLPAGSIIGEPCKRDTAPCVGLAAAMVVRRDPEAILVVMPSDHVISPIETFQQSIRQAAALVEADRLRFVTFGIQPSYPAESFGYIERGEPLGAAAAAVNAFRVQSFREKPSAEVARQYVNSGNYYWNSGIFVWSAQTILDALQQFEPAMYGHIMEIGTAVDTPRFSQVLAGEFAAIQGKSIDFAVMEHYDNVAVIEAPFQWDDVGSWRAIARLHGADGNGNTLLGRSLAVRTSNSIIRSTDDHLIATIGVQNLIVVHTPDATLVVNQDDEEAVREIVKLIEQNGWQCHL